MLGLRVQTFSLPKRGYRPEEYEDAWAHTATRLALADGASDAFESRLWAQALVQAFIHQPPESHSAALLDWLVTPIQVLERGHSLAAVALVRRGKGQARRLRHPAGSDVRVAGR